MKYFQTRIKNLVKWGLILAIFYYLINRIYKDWELVKTASFSTSTPLIIASILLLLFLFFFQVFIWQKILIDNGYSISFWKSYKIFTLSNLGRYIPGKVWQVLGMMYMAEKENIPKSVTAVSAVFVLLLSIIAGAFFVCATFLSNWDFIEKFHIDYFILLLPLCLFSLHPRIMNFVVVLLGKIFKREMQTLNYNTKKLLKYLSLYFFFWLVYGVSFSLFLSGIYPLNSIKEYITIAGIYPSAFLVGYLTLIVPGGIGVREGVVAMLLSYFMPPAVASTIAILSRVWFSAVELISVLLAFRVRQ